MAPKRAKRGKCKAASEPEVVFDQLRFLTPENEETFETLIKCRHIWGERHINLHELHPSVHENLQSRHWLSLYTNIQPPPADLIREFYSNLLVHEGLSGHKVASSIRGVPFTITRERISKALDVPLICTPTYPYSMSPRVDDVMDALCGQSVTWGSDQSISSNEDMHGDPIAATAEDGDGEVDVDTADAAHTGPLSPSLHAMMETIMTTQVAHRQLLHGLLDEVAALRADVANYRRHVPLSSPFDSS
nr:hypothetical protein CFP56_69819 [Quercus suber]